MAALLQLSRTIFPRIGRGPQTVALILCVATLTPAWSHVPKLGTVDAMTGVANQALISGFLQPSSFGVLILAALPTWIRVLEQNEPLPLRRSILTATDLTSLACIFAPTYLITVAIGLTTALLARIPTVTWLDCLSHLTVGLAALMPSIVLNPTILNLAGDSGAEMDEALRRFAFERIPHHTLMSAWPLRDIAVGLGFVAAALVLHRIGKTKIAVWMNLTTVVVVGSSLFVATTESVKVALMFPWRVSVFMSPVASVVLATMAARIALPGRRLPPIAALTAASLLGASGLFSTLTQMPMTETDDATALVLRAHVHGVGFIPLDQENIRLNAGVPVYVDYKSPPYAGDDLIEWWRRVDKERSGEQNPETFCHDLHSQVDWILLERGNTIPSCLNEWPSISAENSTFVLYQSPG